MNKYIQLIKEVVNLNSYGTSKGFIGYYERKNDFKESICHEAIDHFFRAFPLKSEVIVAISSLHIDSSQVNIHEENISKQNLEEVILPLSELGIINQIDTTLFEGRYNSPEFDEFLLQADLNFSTHSGLSEDILKKFCFLPMAIDGVRGHNFLIVNEIGFIAYPHEDSGFGFIAIEFDKSRIFSKVKNNLNMNSFRVVES